MAVLTLVNKFKSLETHPFNSDDIGSKVAQDHAAERPGRKAGDFDHFDTLQGHLMMVAARIKLLG